MKFWKSVLSGLIIGSLCFYTYPSRVHADASPTYIEAYNGTGSNHNTRVYSLDYSGNIVNAGAVTPASGINSVANIYAGTNGVAQSSATTTANTAFSLPVYINNASATAPLQGMIITSTNPVSASQGIAGIVPAATSNLTNVIGVADVTSTTAAVVNVDFSGVAVALTSGTVNPGDLLCSTSAAAGYLFANNSASAGAIVGIALGPGITAGGLTRILLKH